LCGNRSCVNPKHLSVGDVARFWSKVDKSGECWIWKGPIDKDGCGKFNTQHNNDHKTLKAHRFIYELTYGKLDPNMVIMHTCDTNLCVKPTHLFKGTVQEMCARRDQKLKSKKGI
jgi:hypothetical protein